jgi:hypothetical protein
VVARHIVETIDRRISQRTREADRLREADPLAAYNMYTDILAKHNGIDAVEPAKAAYLALKNCDRLKKLLAADKAAK